MNVVLHVLCGAVVSVLLLLAWPQMVEQATAEPEVEEMVQPEDEWCSGATPDYPSHMGAWGMPDIDY